MASNLILPSYKLFLLGRHRVISQHYVAFWGYLVFIVDSSNITLRSLLPSLIYWGLLISLFEIQTQPKLSQTSKSPSLFPLYQSFQMLTFNLILRLMLLILLWEMCYLSSDIQWCSSVRNFVIKWKRLHHMPEKCMQS